jgi:regulator of protease activity HflC (stomatin/prohibitin superfamily)
MQAVRVTEQTLNLDPQLITTGDNLGIIADALVYLRIKPERDSVKAALYNADNCIDQTVDSARTTLRDILATMPSRRVSIDREQIGAQMCHALNAITENWGVEVVRCRLKEIEMPKDVQEIMHKLVKAEHEKLAASDLAAAAELNAEGIKRAEIKKAEGEKQARILAAEAEAKAMRIISEAARQHFTGNAQLYRAIEAAETALKNNAKIVLQDTFRLFNRLCGHDENAAAPEGNDTDSDDPGQTA